MDGMAGWNIHPCEFQSTSAPSRPATSSHSRTAPTTSTASNRLFGMNGNPWKLKYPLKTYWKSFEKELTNCNSGAVNPQLVNTTGFVCQSKRLRNASNSQNFTDWVSKIFPPTSNEVTTPNNFYVYIYIYRDNT